MKTNKSGTCQSAEQIDFRCAQKSYSQRASGEFHSKGFRGAASGPAWQYRILTGHGFNRATKPFRQSAALQPAEKCREITFTFAAPHHYLSSRASGASRGICIFSSIFVGARLQLRQQKNRREAPSFRGAFPASSQPFFAFSSLFALCYPDTLGRDSSHASHWKQRIGLMLSRHTVTGYASPTRTGQFEAPARDFQPQCSTTFLDSYCQSQPSAL